MNKTYSKDSQGLVGLYFFKREMTAGQFQCMDQFADMLNTYVKLTQVDFFTNGELDVIFQNGLRFTVSFRPYNPTECYVNLYFFWTEYKYLQTWAKFLQEIGRDFDTPSHLIQNPRREMTMKNPYIATVSRDIDPHWFNTTFNNKYMVVLRRYDRWTQTKPNLVSVDSRRKQAQSPFIVRVISGEFNGLIYAGFEMTDYDPKKTEGLSFR